MLAFTLAQSSPPETLAKLPGFLGFTKPSQDRGPPCGFLGFPLDFLGVRFQCPSRGISWGPKLDPPNPIPDVTIEAPSSSVEEVNPPAFGASGIATFLTEEK